jgi:hypothetical protein
MKLLTPPWKTAWYDDQISDRFFQEMSRTENAELHDLESSAQWMNQVVIQTGQLAQNMNQLERDVQHPSQIRLAFEKALKLSTLVAHLAAALDRADPERRHTPMSAKPTKKLVARPAQTLVEVPPKVVLARAVGDNVTPQISAENPIEETQPSVAPLRQTVNGLSRRGLSVAEIEVITGQSRTQIETVLNER